MDRNRELCTKAAKWWWRRWGYSQTSLQKGSSAKGPARPGLSFPLLFASRVVLALFAVGDVYVSLCKRGA